MDEPRTPYRDERPLTAIIAPDRRRQKAIALVLAGMIAGAALFALAMRGLADPSPAPVTGVSPPDPAPPVGRREPRQSADVQRVVNQHKVEVRRRCWDDRTGDASAHVIVSATVASDGQVASVHATGGGSDLDACLEREVAAWVFEPSSEATDISIPFELVRR